MDRRQQQKDKLKDIRDRQNQDEFAISEAFKGAHGEKALKILEELFYERPSYTRGEPNHTAFREGQRDVVGYIKEAIARGGDYGKGKD